MPIRRPRGPKPELRHVAFLESMTAAPEGSTPHASARAAFLTLRLLDHWVALGTDLSTDDSSAHRAAREAVDAIETDAEMRASLGSIIDAIVALHEPDAQPLLPRVYAFGKLTEQRGQMSQAADVYTTVARYVDASVHLDLAYDAHMRRGFCLRLAGEFDWSEQAYATAGSLAARAKDRVRVLTSRVGQAKVDWARGNLPAADEAMKELAVEAEKLAAIDLLAKIMHDRSGVARHREDIPRAVRLAFESFRRTVQDFDRERVLNDLATYLMLLGATDSARSAFQVLERVAKSEQTRWSAQIGLMDLAAATLNEPAFESYRRQLASADLPAMSRTSFLLDAGKGLAAFGNFDEARGALGGALQLAEMSGQHQRVFQVEAALKELGEAESRQAMAERASRPEPVQAPDDIAQALEDLLAETAGAI